MAWNICLLKKPCRQAQQSLGGNGYLSNDSFRDYFRCGRILPRHLDAALKPRALSEQVKLGVREITHLDVLRACMLGDTSAPADDRLDAQLARHPDRHTIAALADHLSSAAAAAIGPSKARESRLVLVRSELWPVGAIALLARRSTSKSTAR